MHVIFREAHGLEETEVPTDLGQSPADLVVLSFSDSDLGAFAEAWNRGGGKEGHFPTLRLANLAALKHPLSVDTYVEKTLASAKGILIRLIGGVPYWHYGLRHVFALANSNNIALAVLPADGRADSRLDAFSTLPVSTLRRLAHLCDTGGTIASQAALAQMALAAGFYAGPVPGSKSLPQVGAWSQSRGVFDPADLSAKTESRVLIMFYRSYLAAADTAPIESLINAFEKRGLEVLALYAPSLKAPNAAEWLRKEIKNFAPDAIVNTTAFSGRSESGASPLDAGNVPVFQAALGTSTKVEWDKATRGLSPTDLAMHVVLPEVDGRIMGGITSFKEPCLRDPNLQFSRFIHKPVPDRVDSVADRVAGWLRLAKTPRDARRVALVLSTYPGKKWNAGHAVGLDAPASARAILSDLAMAGYDVNCAGADLSQRLLERTALWSIADYQRALAELPECLQQDLTEVWGEPEDDPLAENGIFRFAAIQQGNACVALQPERGRALNRKDSYHDMSCVPRHAYVAFYLWLRRQVDAIIHIGAHGTLEWLPGKSVALSAKCWPEALIGDMPLVYPFIVNDPGEAAQAKRRIGAVTLGHLPPPQKEGGTPERLVRLEALLDEFSNADGLDPKRRDRLQDDIRAQAQALGVEDDLGLDLASSSAEAITRIDRFVCDVKESQFGDGLHVWGRQSRSSIGFETDPSTKAERQALIDALDGKRIDPGPSGSPYRGRTDVLPTGRNIYTTDPRSVPTRAAYSQGVKLAEELLRRHLQDEGDWPSGLIVDLWGSATMRTAGEEFAMALHLLGVKPVWDEGSERVSGIEVLPLAELDRPRIDVTLRVSGLFRDVFPTLSALYGQAVKTLSAREEEQDWNPYVGQKEIARVYGPAPGSFGLGMDATLEDYGTEGRSAAGEAWLSASSWAFDGDAARQDSQGLRDRVAGADAFVHAQDLPETDLLLAADYAGHEAGFAAAQAVTGGRAALYHLDNTDPNRPRARALPEEVSRVVQSRAANPEWIAGMAAHGFRGAAEIAATLDHMAAFAHLADAVSPHLFDLYYEATLGNVDVDRFLEDANPEARAAMRDRFSTLLDAGLWKSRSNSIRAELEVQL